MKLKTIRTLILLAAGASLLLSLQSCRKDTKTPTTDPNAATGTNGTLMLHIHTNIDDSEVEEINTVYSSSDHRKVSVSMAQLYISGIQLIKSDGTAYDLPGVRILKKIETEEYELGSVPAGNYKSIRFVVGLPPATNTVAPASGDSTLNQPDMWFDATVPPSGFVFLSFQGKIDTTHAANGTEAQMQPFSYRIGTNSNLKTVTMPDQNYSVIPGQVQFIHLTADYNKLFSNITLNQAGNLTMNTASANSSALAAQLAGNIATMFRYEE